MSAALPFEPYAPEEMAELPGVQDYDIPPADWGYFLKTHLTTAKEWFPYPYAEGDARWAWFATTIGAVAGVTTLKLVFCREPSTAEMAGVALIGAWLGAKFILPT